MRHLNRPGFTHQKFPFSADAFWDVSRSALLSGLYRGEVIERAVQVFKKCPDDDTSPRDYPELD